jgi:putative methyltransferase (TIGR04325 family)
LINRLPLYDGEKFVTLINGGLVYYPQYIFNGEEFIGAIVQQGYQLADSWDDFGASCFIPFHPEKDIRACKGLYFLASG